MTTTEPPSPPDLHARLCGRCEAARLAFRSAAESLENAQTDLFLAEHLVAQDFREIDSDADSVFFGLLELARKHVRECEDALQRAQARCGAAS